MSKILNKTKKISVSLLFFIALMAVIVTSINASISDYSTSVIDLAKEAQNDSWYDYSPEKDLIGKKIGINASINYNSAYCIDGHTAKNKGTSEGGYYDIVNVFDVDNNKNTVIVYSLENPKGTEYSLSDERIKPVLMLAYLTQKATENSSDTSTFGYKDVLARIFWNASWIKDLREVGLSQSFHAPYYLDNGNLVYASQKISEAKAYAESMMSQGAIETADLSDSVMTQAEKDRVSISRIDGKTFIGPYRINLNATTVGEIKVDGENAIGISTDMKTVESFDKIVDAKEFYIVTEKDYSEITSITLKANKTISTMKSRMVLLGNSPSQNFLVWKSEEKTKTPETELEAPKLGNLEIQKVDQFEDSTVSLKDIEFKVYASNKGWLELDGEKITFNNAKNAFDTVKPFKTDDAGKISIKNIPTGYYYIYETGLPKDLEKIYQLGKTKVPGKDEEVKGKIVISEELRRMAAIPYRIPVSAGGQTATVKAINDRAYTDVNVHKVDKDTQKPLNGYEFRLYRVDGDNTGWVEAENNTATHTYTKDFNGDKVAKLVTKENGTTTTLESLEVGTYELYETKLGENGEAYDLGKFKKDDTEYDGKLIDTKTVKATKTGAFTFDETNAQEFIKISGKVWENTISGKNDQVRDDIFTESDSLIEGIQVTLQNTKTNETRTTITNENGEYSFENVRIRESAESEDTDYLKNYRVIFVYDGFIYQGNITDENQIIKYEDKTVNNVKQIRKDSSKAVENKDTRNEINNLFDNVTGEGQQLKNGLQLSYIRKDDGKVTIKDIKNRTIVNKATAEEIGHVKVDGKTNFPITAHAQGSLLQEYYNELIKGKEVVSEITNINFGVIYKEMPQLKVKKDVYNAEVSVNDYTYTYLYNQKIKQQNEVETTVGVDFDDDYRFPIHKADATKTPIAGKELKATVTYKIMLQNQTNNLNATINGISEWYSDKYSLAKGSDGEYEIYLSDNEILQTFDKSDRVKGVKYSDKETEYPGYSKALIEFEEPIKLGKATGKAANTKYLYIKFDVKDIKDIYNKDVTLENYVEISSYATYSDNDYKELYAAVDSASIPRNLRIDKFDETDEQDSDNAPGLKLVEATERYIQGTVFEDYDADGKVGTKQERKGNGIFDNGEPTIANVSVKLQQNMGNEWKDIATTTTDSNGNFEFSDFMAGTYRIIYTWGDSRYNVENFKGTIFVNKERANDPNWIKTEDPRYSDAIDSYTMRLAIDKNALGIADSVYTEAQNNLIKQISDKFKGNIDKMNSATPNFAIGIEKQQYEELPGEKGYKFDVHNIDFGIIERPRQGMEINKDLSTVEISTTRGETLASAKLENDGSLTVYSGDKWISGGRDLGYIWIQVAKSITESTLNANMGYNITVSNSSELDYDDENYYKYGEIPSGKANTMKLKATEVYDYCNGADLATTADTTVWNKVSIDKYTESVTEENTMSESYFEENLVKDESGNIIGGNWLATSAQSAEIYNEWLEQMAQTSKSVRNVKLGDKKLIKYVADELTTPLEPGETKTAQIQTAQEVNNGDKIRFENEAEITHIEYTTNQKTGSKPTAYTSKTFDSGEWVTITPETGENKDYTWIIITAVSAIAILGVGIVIIKKKVIK